MGRCSAETQRRQRGRRERPLGDASVLPRGSLCLGGAVESLPHAPSSWPPRRWRRNDGTGNTTPRECIFLSWLEVLSNTCSAPVQAPLPRTCCEQRLVWRG